MGQQIKSHRPGEVLSVDPDQLQEAFAIVSNWAQHIEGDENAHPDEPFENSDLFELLDQIAHRLKVEPFIAVALFKRSLALMSLCAEAEMPSCLFENGLPGRSLCMAASRVPVLSKTGFDYEACAEDGTTVPRFDSGPFWAAYSSALN